MRISTHGPRRLVHDGLPPLPQVKMGVFRQWARRIHDLECMEAGEWLPGDNDPPASGGSGGPEGVPMQGLTCRLVDVQLGLKRTLAEVETLLQRLHEELSSRPLEAEDEGAMPVRAE